MDLSMSQQSFMVWHYDSASVPIRKYMPLININLLLVPSRDELKSTQLQAANAAVPESATCMAEDQTFDEVHIHHLKINQ